MRSDESHLRHPAERSLFLAFAVLNVLLMAVAVLIILKGSDWLRAHPDLAEYVRVLAIAQSLVFLRSSLCEMPGMPSFGGSRSRSRRSNLPEIYASSGTVKDSQLSHTQNSTSRI
jgi:hypothetical protein